MTDIANPDVSNRKLSPVSSEESIVKAMPINDEKPKTSPFKAKLPSSARGRTSGYVEVVTTKDGKRCVRELGHTSSVKEEMTQSPPQNGIREQAGRHISFREQGHSYQNVAEIRRPQSALTSRSTTGERLTSRTSVPSHNWPNVSCADFQLSTVDDSDV